MRNLMSARAEIILEFAGRTPSSDGTIFRAARGRIRANVRYPDCYCQMSDGLLAMTQLGPTEVGPLQQYIGLATGTFTSETATGWQQVNFATPVMLPANTTYTAS